jgi:radical SAM protein with 4Fe4S-binding SPASM domain
MPNFKKTIPHCIAPWTSLYVQHDGNVFPCCLWTRFSPVGNLHKQSLDEVWNSEKMKKLRLDMLEKNFVINCVDCRFNEATNQKSLRHEYLEEQAEHIGRAERTENDGRFDELSPVFLSIAVGTECQLRCRMCGPYDSNAWRVEVGSPEGYRSISEEVSSKKVLELTSLQNDLSRVLFVGGEPLIVPLHYEILKLLLAQKKEKSVELYYNSNLVQLKWKTHSIADYWNQFSKVTLLVSIDGANEQFDFIRTGHSWNRLLTNLEAVRKTCTTTDTFAYITFSLYNFMYIPETIDALLKNNLFTIDKILFNRVAEPLHMNTQNAPDHLKKKARLKYTAFMKKLLNDYDYEEIQTLIVTLNMLLRYVDSITSDESAYQAFLQFNKGTSSQNKNWEIFQQLFPDLL